MSTGSTAPGTRGAPGDDPEDDGSLAAEELGAGARDGDPVQEADEESFPASDPPSWWSGGDAAT